eukprot:476707-Alexandrium_andersonii.AAC.1
MPITITEKCYSHAFFCHAMRTRTRRQPSKPPFDKPAAAPVFAAIQIGRTARWLGGLSAMQGMAAVTPNPLTGGAPQSPP